MEKPVTGEGQSWHLVYELHEVYSGAEGCCTTSHNGGKDSRLSRPKSQTSSDTLEVSASPEAARPWCPIEKWRGTQIIKGNVLDISNHKTRRVRKVGDAR